MIAGSIALPSVVALVLNIEKLHVELPEDVVVTKELSFDQIGGEFRTFFLNSGRCSDSEWFLRSQSSWNDRYLISSPLHKM